MTDRDLAQTLQSQAERLLKTGATAVLGSEYLMDPPNRPVLHQRRFIVDSGSLEVALTEASARPPFEWVVELTYDQPAEDYLRHYLLLTDGRLVRANRKELTPPTSGEIEAIMADLNRLAA